MSDKKIMLDLFSGLGGANFSFKTHIFEGRSIWQVYSIDNNPELYCTHPYDIVKDKNKIIDEFLGSQIDFLWASPPCYDFSLAYPAPRALAAREGRLDEYKPDLAPLKATLDIIKALKPRYYAIENVQGAIRYFKPLIGEHRLKLGSCYFWGNFPLIGFCVKDTKHKAKLFASTNKDTPNRSNVHAKTPLWISEQFRISVQYQMMIDDFAELYTPSTG